VKGFVSVINNIYYIIILVFTFLPGSEGSPAGQSAPETHRHEEPDHAVEPRPGRPAKLAARPPVAVALQPALHCDSSWGIARRGRAGLGALGRGDAVGGK